ncbi:MAG: LytTR family transcriptional regulator DNA-binding domain-containing protein, partial [Prolixibacteraceae bacterium]|nr:LytTR family transcriptional regulator DNA-binding domain-containing protein [Prolixibacteraceae bacterium]
LKDYPIWRIHRKYSVNIQNIKLMIKAPKGYELVMNTPGEERLPVSGSYEKKTMQLLHIQ